MIQQELYCIWWSESSGLNVSTSSYTLTQRTLLPLLLEVFQQSDLFQTSLLLLSFPLVRSDHTVNTHYKSRTLIYMVQTYLLPLAVQGRVWLI